MAPTEVGSKQYETSKQQFELCQHTSNLRVDNQPIYMNIYIYATSCFSFTVANTMIDCLQLRQSTGNVSGEKPDSSEKEKGRVVERKSVLIYLISKN